MIWCIWLWFRIVLTWLGGLIFHCPQAAVYFSFNDCFPRLERSIDILQRGIIWQEIKKQKESYLRIIIPISSTSVPCSRLLVSLWFSNPLLTSPIPGKMTAFSLHDCLISYHPFSSCLEEDIGGFVMDNGAVRQIPRRDGIFDSLTHRD